MQLCDIFIFTRCSVHSRKCVRRTHEATSNCTPHMYSMCWLNWNYIWHLNTCKTFALQRQWQKRWRRWRCWRWWRWWRQWRWNKEKLLRLRISYDGAQHDFTFSERFVWMLFSAKTQAEGWVWHLLRNKKKKKKKAEDEGEAKNVQVPNT